LKDFGLNPANLGADIGMTAVLHTHSRRVRPQFYDSLKKRMDIILII